MGSKKRRMPKGTASKENMKIKYDLKKSGLYIYLDGELDGMDSVEAACIESGMLNGRLKFLLADVDSDGAVTAADIKALSDKGIASVN